MKSTSMKYMARGVVAACFLTGSVVLLGCTMEEKLPATETPVVTPSVPFEQLIKYAAGDSQYHVTQDFTLGMEDGAWTSSKSDVLTVDPQGRATIQEHDGSGAYSHDIVLTNGRGTSSTITVRYPLPGNAPIGYDKLTLHGKFRQYKVNTAKGDNVHYWCTGELLTDGSTCADCASPNDEERRISEGTIVNGIEYPTYWSRLPLSIHADNHDTTKGLYAIQDKGTSAIFPSNEQNLGDRADNNMRQCTAGVYIAFATDSATITLDCHYYHTNDSQANGRADVSSGRSYSGFDIYKIEDGKAVFCQNLRNGEKQEKASFTYTTNTNGKMTQYIVMLPTYNGFEFGNEGNPSGLQLTFAEGSSTYEIDPFAEQAKKPILIYGTSITQGDGANGLRPGGTYAAQVMWATGREVINMGVAGSAQMEYKMADFLANIESEVFVIDPGWNLTSTAITATNCNANGDAAAITNDEIVVRLKYMVNTYRKNHPTTPIIVCPKYLKSNNVGAMASTTAPNTITMPSSFTNTENYLYGRESFLLYKAFLELKAAGVQNIYWAEQGLTTENGKYLHGSDLHPPIQGMTNIANWVLKAISEATPHLYSGGEVQVPQA
ncbi:MAG: hypothetical protein IKW26_01990 [Treponema sp.]|nr:hypothetical protein [Treponema sp.]